MEIVVPKAHLEYLEMLVEAEVYSGREKALIRVFEHGLNEKEFDARVEGTAGADFTLLGGEQATIQVPDSQEYVERLEFISRKSEVSMGKAATLSFLQGLFGHHLALERSHLYKTREDFRTRVDQMPTSMC